MALWVLSKYPHFFLTLLSVLMRVYGLVLVVALTSGLIYPIVFTLFTVGVGIVLEGMVIAVRKHYGIPNTDF